MRAPSGEKDALAPSPHGRAARRSPGRLLRPRSAPCGQSEAVTMRAPSGEKDALCTQSSWPRRAAISAGCRVPDPRRAVTGGGDDAGAVGRKGGALHPALVAAQACDLRPGCRVPDPRRAVTEAVTMRAPSGEKDGALHPVLVARAGRRSPAPVVASQSRAVRSSEAVTMRAPSGETTALRTQSSWPRRAASSLPGCRVPDPRRVVVGGGDDAGAVGREGTRSAPSPRGRAGRDLLARCRVPDPRRAVIGGGDDAGAVGGEGRTPHPALVAAQAVISGPVVASQIRAVRVIGGGDDAGAVGGERRAPHPVIVPNEAQPLGTGRRQTGQRGAGRKSGSCCAAATIPATAR